MIFKMYNNGSTMAEIIRELNALNVKTSRGNAFNKNSIRHILSNEKYLGKYKYKGEVINTNIEPIIDEETFNNAKITLEKNKKAPARSKAIGDMYLLTDKMFCGHCKALMTGVSGTSHTKKFYQYYACNNAKKRKCAKKRIRKDTIEFAVVKKVKEILTPENIRIIAENTVKYFEKQMDTGEANTLKKQLKANKKAIDNLVAAIEQGTPIDIINPQIAKRQAEEQHLQNRIFKLEVMYPTITVPQVMFFMDSFKNGNINDI